MDNRQPSIRQPRSARRPGAKRFKIVDYMTARCGVYGKAGAASGFNVAAPAHITVHAGDR